ncbi:MAG: hypothetical protein K6F83_05225 [Clostridiales bacterium]|nr:hypothetical protein [Clostridiales bacterium]
MKNRENKSSNDNGSYHELYAAGSSTASAAVIEEPETDLNLFPDLILDDSNGSLTVLIKHDYYSSDTEHGRELLGAFLDVLADEFSKVSRIFLIDSGVKLLDPGNPLHASFCMLEKMEYSIVCCRESIDEFEVEFEKKDNDSLMSMHEIALELMNVPYLYTID